MKNVMSFREMDRYSRISQVNEGLLSAISNLFASSYTIKNNMLKELLREVDCPISWREAKLRNSIYKLVDEFVSTQSKAYAEELVIAKDKDDKEENGELVFDSESRFGTLKSKRLVEKANATLSALKNLVGTSKTAQDDVATKWAQIVYDEAVVAIIQTAIESTELDSKTKEDQLELVKYRQENVDKEKEAIHKGNAEYFKKNSNLLDTTIGDDNVYNSLFDNQYAKDLGDILAKTEIDTSALNNIADKMGSGEIEDSSQENFAIVSYCLNYSATDDFKKTIDDFQKNDKEGKQKTALAYRMCDGVLTELSKSSPDANALKKVKPFFGEKTVGTLTDIMVQIMSYAEVALNNLVKDNNIVKNHNVVKTLSDNYNSLWVK